MRRFVDGFHGHVRGICGRRSTPVGASASDAYGGAEIGRRGTDAGHTASANCAFGAGVGTDFQWSDRRVCHAIQRISAVCRGPGGSLSRHRRLYADAVRLLGKHRCGCERIQGPPCAGRCGSSGSTQSAGAVQHSLQPAVQPGRQWGAVRRMCIRDPCVRGGGCRRRLARCPGDHGLCGCPGQISS